VYDVCQLSEPACILLLGRICHWWTADLLPTARLNYRLELPRFTCLLLVAAYVASRTKEQENRQVCDPRARKRRRTGRLAHDKQVSAAVQ
jgi:hypothetical protein